MLQSVLCSVTSNKETDMNHAILTTGAALAILLTAAHAHAQDPCAGLFDSKGNLTSSARSGKTPGDTSQCKTRLESQRKDLDRAARARTQQAAAAITFHPVSTGQTDDASSMSPYLRATAKGACRLELRDVWQYAIPFAAKSGSSWTFGKHYQIQGHDLSNLDMRRYVPEPHGHSGVSGVPNPIPSSNTNTENYTVRFRDAGASTHSLQFSLKVVRRFDEDTFDASLRAQRVQQGLSRLNTVRQTWAAAVDACEDLDAVDARLAALRATKSKPKSTSKTRTKRKSAPKRTLR
jgi:hypothetical protein